MLITGRTYHATCPSSMNLMLHRPPVLHTSIEIFPSVVGRSTSGKFFFSVSIQSQGVDPPTRPIPPPQVFQRHNETCNIWTHLVGLAIFIAITISMAYDWGRYRLPRLPDTWTFGELILILLAYMGNCTDAVFFLNSKGMSLSTPLRRLSTATSGTSPPPRRTPGGGCVSPRRTYGLRSEPRCCRRAIKSGTPSML